ncbi:FK506-binding protein 4 [Penicillium taxi]|uniref:FK506-binding protein 4 n=1 Tax=Penicillium taxi TaxID=168475 RepID=UPI0025452729|nr:FK506-binding protein 4 [Penicillium taxi]KAJ5899228.1 FK506-binding protein 4 [Penicillium taxi]
MSAVQPVAVYALRVPAGAMVEAVPNASASFRITMAAIDPDEAPEYEDDDDTSKPSRATLKIVRPPPGMDLDDEDDEDYSDEEDDEEDSDDEEVNGGPSDKEKIRKLRMAAAQKELEDAMEEDDDEDDDEEEGGFDLKAAISKLIKGKAPLGDDEDDEDDESEEGLELDENVVCTLSADKNFQQPLDITICEGERVFFKVTGNQSVFITGNYVISLDEHDHDHDHDDDDEEDDEYDLSPDEEELDMEQLLAMDQDSDDLDDIEDPRITEVDSDEEEAPKLVEAKTKKGKNKRAAEEGLDDLMAKSAKGKAAKEEPALTKAQQKKLKKNNGDAAATAAAAVETKKDVKSDKKVQFAKNLEQGPTPSAEKPTGTLGVKEVKGVKLDDKKLGQGRAAKHGNTVSMRYIGKLENGSIFDSNKKGKPFSFKLGKGEVIKGWDIGIAGMAAGGERRLTIPAALAYGKKALPGIPAHSKLIFDVKLLEIK